MRRIQSIVVSLAAGWLGLRLYQRKRSRRAWQPAARGTAVITGASSGIGAGFARALARQGYDLLLVARREDRLRALAEEIRQVYPVTVDLLIADLSSSQETEYVAMRIAALENLALLVNNAGFGNRGTFVEIPADGHMAMLQVHVAAVMRLTHAALPVMLRRGQGGIIQLSSMTGFTPIGGNAVYGSTKNYLIFFTRSLREELRGSGVRVQALCPGFTRTEIFGEVQPRLPAFLWLETEQVVAESLRGLAEDEAVVIPGTLYKLIALVLRLPGFAALATRLRPFIMRS